jgi:hypothetical protein
MSQPRRGSPGLRRTVTRDRARFLIGLVLESSAKPPKYQFSLALLALNVLLREMSTGAEKRLLEKIVRCVKW